MEGIRNFWDCMSVFIDIEDPSDCLTSWTFLQDSRIDDLKENFMFSFLFYYFMIFRQSLRVAILRTLSVENDVSYGERQLYISTS